LLDQGRLAAVNLVGGLTALVGGLTTLDGSVKLRIDGPLVAELSPVISVGTGIVAIYDTDE